MVMGLVSLCRSLKRKRSEMHGDVKGSCVKMQLFES